MDLGSGATGTAALWKDAAPFELSPVRQVQAHELVVDQIRAVIMLGRFCPGEMVDMWLRTGSFTSSPRRG